MKNIQRKNRKAHLNARWEKLVELNRQHKYTSMVLVDGELVANPKQDQYTNLLQQIHQETIGIFIFDRENRPEYANQLENAKKSVATLTQGFYYNQKSAV
jgi:macrodomain Ter protein organizer (MatP/YcbG family)